MVEAAVIVCYTLFIDTTDALLQVGIQYHLRNLLRLSWPMNTISLDLTCCVTM